MTLITFQDGKPVLRDGKVGTEQACCCQQQECCADATDCSIRVTVTYSNGVTRNSGENELNEDGDDAGVPIFGSLSCGVLAYSHSGLLDGIDGNCIQFAYKAQKISCATCCEPNACDCSPGEVVSETYDFVPVDEGAVCGTPLNHVTNISFSFVDCGECPCNPLP